MANNYFDFYDGSSWLDLPAPSSLQISFEDIDKDSYRSVSTGNLIRKPISYKWRKVSVSYNFLNNNEATSIMNAYENKKEVTIRVSGPKGLETLNGYISRCDSDLIRVNGGYGFSLSFNFIESRR